MFNLSLTRRLSSDTGPYLPLTEDDLVVLTDGNTSGNSVDVSAGQTIAIICDLDARYRLSSLNYYRSAASTENIAIYGKQGEGSSFPWVELPHTDEGDHLSVNLSVLNDKYMFLKVVHTVIAGTSSVFEFEVLSDDQTIEYGEQGEISKFSVDSGTITLFPERIVVRNPNSSQQTFYILTDGADPNSEGLSISTSSSGIFQSLYESGLSLPGDIPWSSGHFEETEESSNQVVLISGTSGTYYTPVIDVSSIQGRRFFWNATTSGNDRIDDLSSVDSVPTVGLRFSNIPPSDVGWTSGQLSNDSLWSVVSGTLSFDPYPNYTILDPNYYDYFQAKVEFSTDTPGLTPVLKGLGIEEGLQVSIPANSFGEFYAKSDFSEHFFGRQGVFVIWFFDSRNEEQ